MASKTTSVITRARRINLAKITRTVLRSTGRVTARNRAEKQCSAGPRMPCWPSLQVPSSRRRPSR